MISWMQGSVFAVAGNIIHLRTGNIGYQIMVPPGLFEETDVNKELQLAIYQEWRNDGFHLYGFNDFDQRFCFCALRTITGVGGKHALNLLGLFKPAQLLDIAIRKDSEALLVVAGIGKKLANRIISELATNKKFIAKFDNSLNLAVTNANSADLPTMIKIEQSLLNLGYAPRAIKECLASMSNSGSDNADWSEQKWIKECLQHLSANVLDQSTG